MLNVPVLMYHEIVGKDTPKSLGKFMQKRYLVEESVFCSQIEFLSNSNYVTVTVSQLQQGFEGKQQKLACLTFDDGFAGNYSYAFKELSKRCLKATFFITTDLIGMPNMLTWEQIKEMSDYGMEIGSHTCSHVLLGIESEATIKRELLLSKETIENNIGKEAISVSYPNGSYSSLINKIAREVGYKCACSSDVGYWDAAKISFVIPRMTVLNSVEIFRKIIAQDSLLMRSTLRKEKIKKTAKVLLGRKLYNSLYLKLFGLKELTNK